MGSKHGIETLRDLWSQFRAKSGPYVDIRKHPVVAPTLPKAFVDDESCADFEILLERTSNHKRTPPDALEASS